MRILVFNPSYPPVACGVGAYTRGLAQALVRAGHDVTVITGAASTTTTDGPPRVLPPLRNWGVREFLRAWPRFARPRPDVVVSCYPSVAARTVVRHNPSTVPVAAPDPQADARMRAALAPHERPVIGFIGLLWAATKGFEELLEALAGTDALLVATGALDPANPYQAHVAAQIERLGLGERVRWLGFIGDDEAGRLLRVVDAVVLPYRGGAESGYTSLLGALVNGAAVITTRGPQTPPWLRDGETALLVDPEDPVMLASAIDHLLSNERLAAQVRAGARGLSFGWDEIVQAVVVPGGRRRARHSRPGRAPRSLGVLRNLLSRRRE